MSIGKSGKSGFERLARLGVRPLIGLMLVGGGLLSLTACGGYPMTVEQRYSEPKSQDQILQDKVEAARRAERAHGGAAGSF